jgi:hypothetical protein
MSANAKAIFNKLLDGVVDGVNAIAAEIDRPAQDEFVATAFTILALAISKLPPAEREETLLAIEDGRTLRTAVAGFPGAQDGRGDRVLQ